MNSNDLLKKIKLTSWRQAVCLQNRSLFITVLLQSTFEVFLYCSFKKIPNDQLICGKLFLSILKTHMVIEHLVFAVPNYGTTSQIIWGKLAITTCSGENWRVSFAQGIFNLLSEFHMDITNFRKSRINNIKRNLSQWSPFNSTSKTGLKRLLAYSVRL